MVLDHENAVDGKVSMRVQIEPSAPRGRRGIQGACWIPETGGPVPVVLSAYVKASGGLKNAFIHLQGMESEEAYTHADGRRRTFRFFEPAAEWRRVAFRGRIDPSLLHWKTVRGGRLGLTYAIGAVTGVSAGAKGAPEALSFWVDAVQLEIGEKATEFSAE